MIKNKQKVDIKAAKCYNSVSKSNEEILSWKTSTVYEFKAEQKHEEKWLLLRILLIIASVLYTVGYLALIISTRIIPLGALIPLTLWILIFFTWRYANPDYEYTIASGVMSYYVRYGNKKKKKLKAQIRLSEAETITPLSQIKKTHV